MCWADCWWSLHPDWQRPACRLPGSLRGAAIAVITILGFITLLFPWHTFNDDGASILRLPLLSSPFRLSKRHIKRKNNKAWCIVLANLSVLSSYTSLPLLLPQKGWFAPLLTHWAAVCCTPLSSILSSPCMGPTAARTDSYKCSAWLSSSSDCFAIKPSVSFRAGKQNIWWRW